MDVLFLFCSAVCLASMTRAQSTTTTTTDVMGPDTTTDILNTNTTVPFTTTTDTATSTMTNTTPTTTTTPTPTNNTTTPTTDTTTTTPTNITTTPTTDTTTTSLTTDTPTPTTDTTTLTTDTPTPTTDTTTPPPTNNTTTQTTDTTTPTPTTNTTTPTTNDTTTPTPTTNTTTPTTTDTTTPTPTTNTTTPTPTTNTTTPTTTDTTTPTPTTNTTTPTTTDTTTPTPTNNTTTPTTTDTTTPTPTTNTTTPTQTTNTTTATPTTNTTTPKPTINTTTPAPSTLSTAPSTAGPLVCDNGGVAVGGVCICPDDWTGLTCSEENFCRSSQLAGFHFPQTPVGWFSYSDEVCPAGTRAAGKPRASTRCSRDDGPPSFQDSPQVLQCDQTLSDLQQNLTSPADLEVLASSTQILTSRPEDLTAENVTAAAQIANSLLLSPNATQSVRVAAIATVSQLLNASTPDSGEENNATLGLTLTLDQLSVNLSLSQNSSRSQVVQPNLVVQSAQVPAHDTQGVQFTSLSGTSGSFVADRIQLNTNTSTVEVENGFIADAVIYVRFSAEPVVLQPPSAVSLGFVLYQNDRFFRSRRYRRRRASIRVLSASVSGRGRQVLPQHVEMMFRPKVPGGTSLYDFSCVFWDFGLQDWSTAGCWRGNASDGRLTCFCNHTTNFAALWSFRENYKYAEALDAISIVGLSFSVLGLILTIVHHLRDHCGRSSGERSGFRNSQLPLLSICFSLLLFILTFLFGVGNSRRGGDAPLEGDAHTNPVLESDEHVEPDGGPCSAVAALLHFFLLATFVWSGLYGGQLLLLVTTVRRHLPPYWTRLSLAVGWGVPAVVMATTLGAAYRPDDPLRYRQEEFCWLAALDKNKHFSFMSPMFWGFLLPVALILIYNLVLLVLVSMTTCRTDPALNRRASLLKKVLTSVSLSVLLGLSWALGYLLMMSSGATHLLLSLVFCLTTTTQGFQIFVFFTARTPSFRAAVSRSVSSISIRLRDSSYSLKTSWDTGSSESYRDLRDTST